MPQVMIKLQRLSTGAGGRCAAVTRRCSLLTGGVCDLRLSGEMRNIREPYDVRDTEPNRVHIDRLSEFSQDKPPFYLNGHVLNFLFCFVLLRACEIFDLMQPRHTP